MADSQTEIGLFRRVYYALRFRWRTRRWDRNHGPACPARYGAVDCCGIEGWCRTTSPGSRLVMRRLWCRFFGHDNVWTFDPLQPDTRIVVCLSCGRRAYIKRTP